jgi:hypothetical protein
MSVTKATHEQAQNLFELLDSYGVLNDWVENKDKTNLFIADDAILIVYPVEGGWNFEFTPINAVHTLKGCRLIEESPYKGVFH